MEQKEPRAITTDGKEYYRPAAKLLSDIFMTDPVIRYMLAPAMPNQEEREAYIYEYFCVLLTAAYLNSAVFDEIGNWKACMVRIPPGKRVDNPWTLWSAGFFGSLWKVGLKGGKRMLLEFDLQTNAAKAKALKKGEKHYYVFFIGTREDARGQGLASDLMREYQRIAHETQTPIWLEATTPRSHRLYAKLGWEDVEEILLGKGTTSPDGLPEKGGPGVCIWAMLWRPTPAPST